jgi:hypothetical protein
METRCWSGNYYFSGVYVYVNVYMYMCGKGLASHRLRVKIIPLSADHAMLCYAVCMCGDVMMVDSRRAGRSLIVTSPAINRSINQLERPKRRATIHPPFLSLLCLGHFPMHHLGKDFPGPPACLSSAGLDSALQLHTYPVTATVIGNCSSPGQAVCCIPRGSIHWAVLMSISTVIVGS